MQFSFILKDYRQLFKNHVIILLFVVMCADRHFYLTQWPFYQ